MKQLGKVFSTIKNSVREHRRDTILLAKAETSLAVATVAVKHLAATDMRLSEYRLALKVVTERIESLRTAGDAYADISTEIVRDLFSLAVKAPRECTNQVQMIQEIIIALQVNEVIKICPSLLSFARKVAEFAGSALLLTLLTALILHVALG
jgi:hypothetical protein